MQDSFVFSNGDNKFTFSEKASGSDFKVSVFTDTHFDFLSKQDAYTLRLINETLDKEKPHLLIFLGDFCLGKFATAAAARVCDQLEKRGQYWAFVMGNHDGECIEGGTREKLFKLYADYPHCIAQNAQGVLGQGNFFIDILNSNGSIRESLIFIDSGGSHASKEEASKYGLEYKSGYDFIKPENIIWYGNEIKARQIEKPDVTSTLFIHIPLPEYYEAYRNKLLDGYRYERECCSKINSGMFNAIKKASSTRLVLAGHDHVNCYIAELCSVKMGYALSSSFSSYNSRCRFKNRFLNKIYKRPFPDGHTSLTYCADGNVIIKQVYNSEDIRF